MKLEKLIMQYFLVFVVVIVPVFVVVVFLLAKSSKTKGKFHTLGTLVIVAGRKIFAVQAPCFMGLFLCANVVVCKLQHSVVYCIMACFVSGI